MQASILWRRLDQEGHDGCLLAKAGDGWSLKGQAVFMQGGAPCGLSYEIDCDAGWGTRAARVEGFLGGDALHYQFDRLDDGDWMLNGEKQAQVMGLIDLDLGFTPASNLLPIRRFDLRPGIAMPAPAAYLAFPELRLERLDQIYRRLDDTRYAYAAPKFGYDEVLEVAPSGFVVDYPRLWKAIA
ncbi:putative glycolipid-binding domain-containing protein [Mesorhizobium silamurunense]|uniref:putative glycolipid-binding domain-containing protein n=1 Tax=Mesorhizobium silamurunense TaxID=499528 RepID=UPI00177FC3E8|nr:putative glycolipid-binding domain-containing protein [Mesorhizobium silamurunense]